MSIIYGETKYIISEFMKAESAFIKECLQDWQEIILSMFEKEFKVLNSDTFDVRKYNTVDEINHMYDALGYFGIDSLIETLDEHVYWLEMTTRVPEGLSQNMTQMFVITRNVQMSRNTKLSQEFFERHPDVCVWNHLCRNTGLPEEFFERHPIELDWLWLSANTSMSEDFFFLRHPENIIWFQILQTKTISEARFKNLLNLGFLTGSQINWISLCLNTGISEEFFELHLESVDWCYLCQNSNISEEFFEAHLESVVWDSISRNTGISEEFFELHLESVDWYYLCQNSNISEEFFEAHLESVVWDSISRNTGISEEFFESHLESVNWYYLCQNTNISEEFFEIHFGSIEWDSISGNTGISEEFFLRHIEHICPKNILGNTNLSIEFVLKYCPEDLLAFDIDDSDIIIRNRKVRLDPSQDKYNNKSWMRLLVVG